MNKNMTINVDVHSNIKLKLCVAKDNFKVNANHEDSFLYKITSLPEIIGNILYKYTAFKFPTCTHTIRFTLLIFTNVRFNFY